MCPQLIQRFSKTHLLRSLTKASSLLVAMLGLSGCESSAPAHHASSSSAGPLVATATGRSTGAAPVEDEWDGRGASKVEFGRVLQSNPVTIDGKRTIWGVLGGATVGGAVAYPRSGGTGAIVVGAAGTVGGAVLGSATEEALTRREGQEIVVRLEEGRVVTVTQGAEDGYFQEGDLVKVVHSTQGGAYVSLTNAAERDRVKDVQEEKRGPAWYEER